MGINHAVILFMFFFFFFVFGRFFSPFFFLLPPPSVPTLPSRPPDSESTHCAPVWLVRCRLDRYYTHTQVHGRVRDGNKRTPEPCSDRRRGGGGGPVTCWFSRTGLARSGRPQFRSEKQPNRWKGGPTVSHVGERSDRFRNDTYAHVTL